jgi:hypothetical protein
VKDVEGSSHGFISKYSEVSSECPRLVAVQEKQGENSIVKFRMLQFHIGKLFVKV